VTDTYNFLYFIFCFMCPLYLYIMLSFLLRRLDSRARTSCFYVVFLLWQWADVQSIKQKRIFCLMTPYVIIKAMYMAFLFRVNRNVQYVTCIYYRIFCYQWNICSDCKTYEQLSSHNHESLIPPTSKSFWQGSFENRIR
jgi:hypothetical protein